MNVFGAQGGVMDKSVVQFEFEKLSTGGYKVVPKADLEPGEYCFFCAGAAPAATYGFGGPSGGGKVVRLRNPLWPLALGDEGDGGGHNRGDEAA